MENINNNINTGADNGANEGAASTDTSITLSKEELALMLQKEGDKRVSSAQKKWESEIDNRIGSHLKDYERKAQMTPEQLRQLDLDSKLKELDEREKKYKQMEKKISISRKLEEKKLSTVLADFVYDDDLDVAEQKISTLEQLILGMVNEQVDKRISSNTPKAAMKSDSLTKEGFKKMSISERQTLFDSNPSLYRQLSQG